MEEIWKEIPGYDRYMVSNMGRVKSLIRGENILNKLISGKFGNQYHAVFLYFNNGRKFCKVHKLVMLAFIGESKLHVDHVNGNKLDNRLENLRYCTVRENLSFDNRKYKKHLASKYVGVSIATGSRKRKWRSRIEINGKTKVLGYFEFEKDASEAYQNALKNLVEENVNN